MSTNIADQKIRWFNAHTEACGYLDGLKEVKPAAGQNFKPFWATTFCMLEGNPENPRKTYVSVSIANAKIVELLTPHADQLNADKSRVFVTARIADLAAEPFIYSEKSQSAGQLGVNWKAKLIMLLALKVGDMTIELKKDTTTDYGVKVGKTAEQRPQTQDNNAALFDLPLIVALDKNEPGFEVTKQRLKDTGYRWNGDRAVWYLANIALEKSDPAFQKRYEALKAAGYSFSNNVWNIPSAPKQQGGYHRQGNQRPYQVSQRQ